MRHDHLEDLAVTLALSVLLGFLAIQGQLEQRATTVPADLQAIKETLENLANRACLGLQDFLANLVFHYRPCPDYQAKTDQQDCEDHWLHRLHREYRRHRSRRSSRRNRSCRRFR